MSDGVVMVWWWWRREACGRDSSGSGRVQRWFLLGRGGGRADDFADEPTPAEPKVEEFTSEADAAQRRRHRTKERVRQLRQAAAATLIASFCRRYLARHLADALRAQKRAARLKIKERVRRLRRASAATVIESCCRMHFARRVADALRTRQRLAAIALQAAVRKLPAVRRLHNAARRIQQANALHTRQRHIEQLAKLHEQWLLLRVLADSATKVQAAVRRSIAMRLSRGLRAAVVVQAAARRRLAVRKARAACRCRTDRRRAKVIQKVTPRRRVLGELCVNEKATPRRRVLGELSVNEKATPRRRALGELNLNVRANAIC